VIAARGCSLINIERPGFALGLLFCGDALDAQGVHS
jgi:hypothetical protein